MATCFVVLTVISISLLSVNGQTCSGRTPCPNNGLCDPNTNQCAKYNATYVCGKYGDFLNCNSAGVVIGECGSGDHDDCTDPSKNLCPNDKDIYEGIECNYPALGKPKNETKWICGKYGTELSCKNYDGSALVGVCGAGRREDCQKYCDGYHAIQCATNDYLPINWNKCNWQKGTKGQWLYCPSGYIATGHCGSGFQANCGFEIYHELQCCELIQS